jgi:hypothetical protein
MSRGLGALQREILATLEAARYYQTSYRGGDVDDYGWVRYHSREFRLPDDVYDMRQSLAYIASAHGKVSQHYTTVGGVGVDSAFQASFSRALKGLHAGGYLAASATDCTGAETYVACACEFCAFRWDVDRRFVRRTLKPAILPLNVAMYNAYHLKLTDREQRENDKVRAMMAAMPPDTPLNAWQITCERERTVEREALKVSRLARVSAECALRAPATPPRGRTAAKTKLKAQREARNEARWQAREDEWRRRRDEAWAKTEAERRAGAWAFALEHVRQRDAALDPIQPPVSTEEY